MSTRTEFIVALAGATAVPSVAPKTTRSPKPAGKTQEPSFHFDRERFAALLNRSAAHKQVFGARKIAGGSVLYGMNNSISAYEDFLKEPPGSMHAAAVFYHGASIALAMSDTVWNELIFPVMKKASAEMRKEFDGLRPGKGNPYLRSASSDPGDVSIQSLVKRGSTFFVCHNAVVGFAGQVADIMKVSLQKAHDAIMAGIVPGALVVPAGVMAINACQEAKFTYIATD